MSSNTGCRSESRMPSMPAGHLCFPERAKLSARRDYGVLRRPVAVSRAGARHLGPAANDGLLTSRGPPRRSESRFTDPVSSKS
jgi:hypothetical protein